MNQGGFKPNQTGKATPYDNTASGMAAINVGDAIDELKGIAAAGSMGIIPFVFTGDGLTANEWLAVSYSSLEGEETQYVVPWASKIVGFSFMSDTDLADCDFEIHHCTTTGLTTTRDFVFQIRNYRSAHASSFTPVQLAAGDRLAVYAVDQGGDPSDVLVTVFVQITSLTASNTGRAYSGSLTRTATGGTTVAI